MTITPGMKQAVERAGREPVRLSDPETGDAYYLVKQEVFDRLGTRIDDTPDPRQVGMLVNDAMREDDGGDPLLDSYQKYRP